MLRTKEKSTNKYIMSGIILLVIIMVYPNIILISTSLLYVISFIIGFTSIPFSFLIVLFSCTRFFNLYTLTGDQGGLSDLAFIITVASLIKMVINYLTDNKKDISRKFHHKEKSIIIVMMLLIPSIFVSLYYYGQPIYRGIFSMRSYLIYLYILPMYQYLCESDDKEFFFKITEKLTVFTCIIIILQYCLSSKIVFMNTNISQRYGITTIVMQLFSPILCLLIGYELIKLVDKLKNKNVRNYMTIIKLLIMLLTLLLVIKTRIFMFCVMIVFVFFVFVIKNNINIGKKIYLFLIINIIFIGFALLTPYIKSTFDLFFNDIQSQGSDYIRFKAKDYYMSIIPNHFWGAGITNIKFINSPIIAGSNQYFYLADIGIWGYYFEFGILGIIAYVLFLVYLICKSYRYRKCYEYYKISMLLFIISLSTCYTVNPFSIGMINVILICISYLFAKEAQYGK